MNIFFRLNISNKIGTGHFYRCLNLARSYREKDFCVRFICNNSSHEFLNNLDIVTEFEFLFIKDSLGQKEDAIKSLFLMGNKSKEAIFIVDSYLLDEQFESEIKEKVKFLIAIDDLANRTHDCDLLVDATLGRLKRDYENYVSSNTRLLLGPEFALISDSFKLARDNSQKESKDEKFEQIHIHLFFGGNDEQNYTKRFSTLLLSLDEGISLTVVTGLYYPFENELKQSFERFKNRVSYYPKTKDMAATMRSPNMAIGAPGTTTWERACMGLPGIYLSTVENQIPILKLLEEKGMSLFLGHARKVSDKHFLDYIAKVLGNKDKLISMRECSLESVKGLGTIRVVDETLKLVSQ